MQKIIFIIIIAIFYGCTTTEPDEMENKMAVRLIFTNVNGFYNRLDSIVITRLATWPDSTNLNNIGLDGIEIKLATINGLSVFNAKFKQTAKGVYKLDESGQQNSFYAKSCFQAIFTDLQGNYDPINAIYEVNDNDFKLDASKRQVDNSWIKLDENSDNTIFYSSLPADSSKSYIQLYQGRGRIDSVKIRSYYQNVPQQYWLEDTTTAVWNNYPPQIRNRKSKFEYAKPVQVFENQNKNYLDLNNFHFYHSGTNYLKIYYKGYNLFYFTGGFGRGEMNYKTSATYPLYIYSI